MSRNNFSKWMYRSSLSLLIFWMVMNTSACDTSWVNQAVGIVNLLIPAVSAILALVGALGANIGAPQISLVTSWGNQIISDLQNTILPLLNDYNSASATDQPGIISQIRDALTSVQDNTTSLLSALHIDNPAIQAKAVALIQLIQSMIVSLVNFVPVIEGKMSLSEAHHRGIIPHSAGQFKKLFNQEMTRKERDTVVDNVTPKFVLS